MSGILDAMAKSSPGGVTGKRTEVPTEAVWVGVVCVAVAAVYIIYTLANGESLKPARELTPKERKGLERKMAKRRAKMAKRA